jgi:hypothetical protein
MMTSSGCTSQTDTDGHGLMPWYCPIVCPVHTYTYMRIYVYVYTDCIYVYVYTD